MFFGCVCFLHCWNNCLFEQKAQRLVQISRLDSCFNISFCFGLFDDLPVWIYKKFPVLYKMVLWPRLRLWLGCSLSHTSCWSALYPRPWAE
ncbi:unnamed protein product [Oikopleura dioica]|uniref:Uncharacterized protein n=1 Tax=Oikopleura dioica TaxID=34765 RepID=E4YZB9_OIKDI|nr:unnamed protein product [Oikopleura dioica]